MTLAMGTAGTDDSGTVNETTGWHQGAQKLTESVSSSLVIEIALVVVGGGMLFSEAAKATSNVRAEPKTVPLPGGRGYRPNAKYSVYEIRQGGKLWKYGVTSGANANKRPGSQISKCGRYVCSYEIIHRNIRGYYNARDIDMGT